ncbi:MAG: phage tail tape measure protein [Verrucomicrobiota bacterium]
MDAITTHFGSDTTGFERGTKRMNKSVDNVESKLTKAGSTIKQFGGALLTAFSVAKVKEFVNELDGIGKSAGKIGVTTDEIQILRFAAEQTGGSASALDNALEKFNNRLGEARQGLGEGKRAFDELNISLFDSDGIFKDNIDVLAEFATKLDDVEDPARKAALVNDLVGRSAGFLINTLRGGEGALDKYRQQLEEANGIIDEEAIKRAEDFNDRLNLLSKTIEGTLSDAYLEGSKAFEKLFLLIGEAQNFLGSGVSPMMDFGDFERQQEQMKEIEASEKRVAELRSARDAKEAAAAAERKAAAKEAAAAEKLKQKRIEEQFTSLNKLRKAEDSLSRLIEKHLFEQLSLGERKVYLEQELKKIETDQSRTSSELKRVELRREQLMITRQLITNEEEISKAKSQQASLLGQLSDVESERKGLIGQAEQELKLEMQKADEAERALRALQKQAIARAAGGRGNSRDEKDSRKAAELRQEAGQLENEGRFSAAARKRGRAEEKESEITDRRRERLFEDANEARDRGDLSQLEQLKKIAQEQGLIDENGRDSRTTQGEDLKDAEAEKTQKLMQINERSASAVEEINERLAALEEALSQ